MRSRANVATGRATPSPPPFARRGTQSAPRSPRPRRAADTNGGKAPRLRPAPSRTQALRAVPALVRAMASPRGSGSRAAPCRGERPPGRQRRGRRTPPRLAGLGASPSRRDHRGEQNHNCCLFHAVFPNLFVVVARSRVLVTRNDHPHQAIPRKGDRFVVGGESQCVPTTHVECPVLDRISLDWAG